MSAGLDPVPGAPGFFYPNSSMQDLGGGFYSTGNLVETSPGSNLWRARGDDPRVPAITVFLDGAPCPRAEIYFGEFPTNAASITLIRAAGGRVYEVPGVVRRKVSGAWAGIDTEIPFGIDVVYRAQMFDEAGNSIGYTPASAPAYVDERRTWIQNPLNPAGAVVMAFRGNAFRELTRPTEGETFYPQGRGVGVVVSGQRRGLTGMTMDVIADTLAQANKFAALTGTYADDDTVPVLCVRIGSRDRVRIPRPLYASATELTEVDVDYNLGGTKIAWAWTGDEVARPAASLIVPTLTNADLRAHYRTNAAMAADNATNIAITRRYDLAGSAA